MIKLPAKVHTLRSVKTKEIFGFRRTNQSYIIGFIQWNEVQYVSRVISENSIACINNEETHKQNPFTTINDNGFKRILVYFYEPSEIKIAKEILPQEDWNIETVPIEKYLHYPSQHNIGIVFVLKKINDTDKDIVYRTQIIEPLNEAEFFRNGLDKTYLL